MRSRADSEYSFDDSIIAPRRPSMMGQRPVIKYDIDDEYKQTALTVRSIGDGAQEQILKKKLRRMSLTFSNNGLDEEDEFKLEIEDESYM